MLARGAVMVNSLACHLGNAGSIPVGSMCYNQIDDKPERNDYDIPVNNHSSRVVFYWLKMTV